MMNIGIDFGSTNTIVAGYKNRTPVVIQPDVDNSRYPSVVARDKKRDQYCYARSAKESLGDENYVCYRGFKMLLNEQMSDNYLKERGFDETNTPEYITERFLRHVIETTLEGKNDETVNNIVLGAPECWVQSINTVDARNTLRKICDKLRDKITGEIRIISEPICAAAYTVWNYERIENKKLSGNILVIDYGGGTLDTALVEVKRSGNRIQMKAKARSGRGENTEGEIGKAGIAYQEAVIRLAVSEAHNISPSKVEKNDGFEDGLLKIEDFLRAKSKDIADFFEEHCLQSGQERITILKGRSAGRFFYYDEKKIQVNFYHLEKAYNEVIQTTLDTVLRETTSGLTDMSNIYLATVGGFSNFYLVKKQVSEFFYKSHLMRRERNITMSDADREDAVAFGADLFAENIIDLCRVAEIGIGMYAQQDGNVFTRYAINVMEEYEPGIIYFAKDASGKDAPMTLLNYEQFLLDFGPNRSRDIKMIPKSEFAEKLKEIAKKYYGATVFVGFSIGEDERITVHFFHSVDNVSERPEKGQKIGEEFATIPLSTIRDSFTNTVRTTER